MNPGLFIKLRPTGPWRIGPDSGARNRVDVIYHSDSVYSAVTGAMARMGSLDAWLDATARAAAPAVCFGSCFPFLDEIGFVVPPRTLWPPTSPALMSAAVRWKSARFVPLGVVQAMLAGQPLNKNHWSVDGASGCLVPVGRTGPFRTSVRWSAAVDRLSGASERHATACIEFRPGAGLWTIVSFASDAARDRWAGPVKAAFRLLADTGFGGERSRGWGRTESPEFIEGSLPDMIVPPPQPEPVKAAVIEPREIEPLVAQSPVPPIQEPPPEPPPEREPDPLPQEPAPIPPFEEPPASMSAESVGSAVGAVLAESADPAPPSPEPLPEPEQEPPIPSPDPTEPEPLEAVAEADVPEPGPLVADVEPPAADAEPVAAAEPEPEPPAAEPEPEPEPPAPVPAGLQAHWLLSLFSPAPADSVDWGRGNYTVLARGGRVDSPAGSGELKKQVRMVAEGSVIYSGAQLSGAAADVAPDGFAHPVFRAGFAVAIPLPEGRR
jgi:CRISPR type III-A-associated RAMP protein Csm4